MNITLHPYQQRALQWILDKPRCALWLDPGLGKTGTTLKAIRALYDDYAISKVLIVGPKRVVTSTWPAEIAKWQVGLDYSLIMGMTRNWQKATWSKAPIHLVNYEKLPVLIEFMGGRFDYDMIVLDESSKMKSHSAKRFKALRKAIPKRCRVVELTGTPASNGLMDLWAQIFLLDSGERLGKTITKYRQTWFDSDYMGFKWTPKTKAQQQIESRLKDVCLSMSAADYLDLPDRIDNHIRVELPAPAMRQYKQLEKDLLLEMGDTEITAVNAAVLTGKLMQLTAGALYDEDKHWHPVHDAKLDALDDLIEELSGTPLLVFYLFQSDLARLQQRFPQATVLDQNPDTIDRWNAGQISLLLAQPASASHGLNLQQGSNHMAWFGLTWSLEHYIQACARLHRQGQNKPTFIHHIIASGTIDERVMEVLEGKATVQQALMTALKLKESQ